MQDFIKNIKKIEQGHIFHYQDINSFTKSRSISITKDPSKGWILFVISGNRDNTMVYNSLSDALERVNFYYYKYNYTEYRIDPPEFNDKESTEIINKILNKVDINKTLKKIKFNYKPCVYGLFLGEKCVYVGQSVTLFSRIDGHKRDKKKKFDSFCIFEYEDDEQIRLTIESLFIIKYNPPYNKSRGTNLNYGLARQIFNEIKLTNK